MSPSRWWLERVFWSLSGAKRCPVEPAFGEARSVATPRIRESAFDCLQGCCRSEDTTRPWHEVLPTSLTSWPK